MATGNGERLVIVTGITPGGLIVRLSCLIAAPDAESVTFTMIVAVPAVPGVPEMTPAGLNDNPAGNGFEVGSRLQTYPGMPPVAANVWLYATPTLPPGRAKVVIVNGLGAFTRQFGRRKSTDEGPTFTVFDVAVYVNV